jgi:hypothetical protein
MSLDPAFVEGRALLVAARSPARGVGSRPPSMHGAVYPRGSGCGGGGAGGSGVGPSASLVGDLLADVVVHLRDIERNHDLPRGARKAGCGQQKVQGGGIENANEKNISGRGDERLMRKGD